MYRELIGALRLPLHSEEDKQLLLEEAARARLYEPFHVDCRVTKKKVCYCPAANVALLSEGQQASLGAEAARAKRFFRKIGKERGQQLDWELDNIREKVRKMSRADVVRFLSKGD
jgi:hypothetical protein